MARRPSKESKRGFFPQPNDWTCGPFALKHALITLGRLADADQIAEVAKSHWWSGTDEIRLARAARVFDCDLVYDRTRDPVAAKRLLLDYLRSKVPVMLCVDGWAHWITVVRGDANRFVVIDSNLDPVLAILSWKELRSRWCYLDTDYDEIEPPPLYDLLAVEPRFRVTVKADFSFARIKFLRRPENKRLALHWNEYLEDLLEICHPPSNRYNASMTMGEFLRRNQDLIASRIVYWHGDIDRTEIARLLKNFRFVSETYGLVIPESQVRRALTDIAILVTMWVIGKRGISPLYGETT